MISTNSSKKTDWNTKIKEKLIKSKREIGTFRTEGFKDSPETDNEEEIGKRMKKIKKIGKDKEKIEGEATLVGIMRIEKKEEEIARKAQSLREEKTPNKFPKVHSKILKPKSSIDFNPQTPQKAMHFL